MNKLLQSTFLTSGKALLKSFVVLFFFFSRSQFVEAQVYIRSAGVRMDANSVGLSMVQRIFKPVTIEGIIDFRQRDFGLALVPRVHSKIIGRRLNAFIGFGAQTGFVKVDSQKLQGYWGIGGMFGLEYKFNLLPIHISYDFRPLLQLDGHPDLFGFQSSFAIRIVKKSERKAWKEKLKKWREDAKDWFEED
jgi:hypothetical protein